MVMSDTKRMLKKDLADSPTKAVGGETLPFLLYLDDRYINCHGNQ